MPWRGAIGASQRFPAPAARAKLTPVATTSGRPVATMSGHNVMAGHADDQGWTDFEAWCRRRRLRPLPAHPWTVAAFVRWCEARHSYASIIRRVKAIARRHLLAGLPAIERHPLVLRTLRLVERHEQTRGQRAALFPEPTGDPARSTSKPAAAPARSRRGGGLAASPKLVSRRPSPG